jgi:transcriptional repressor NrdR
MVCPFCTNKDTSVYNSRQTVRLNNVWRRRRCDKCNKVFTTTESVDPGSVIKVAGTRTLKPFSSTILLLSIFKVCDHMDDPEQSAQYVSQTVLQKLYKIAAKNHHLVGKEEITTAVLETLKPYNLAAYVKYLSYNAPDMDPRILSKRLKETTS